MTGTSPAGRVAAMSDRLKAIGLMCMAVTLFSCLDTTAKYLVTHAQLPTAEVVWLRFVGQLLLMVADPRSECRCLSCCKPEARARS